MMLCVAIESYRDVLGDFSGSNLTFESILAVRSISNVKFAPRDGKPERPAKPVREGEF